MITKEDLAYRQVITLRDGARVLIRPLVPSDRQALLDFFLPVPLEERKFFRHNVSDPQIVSAWAENVNYDDVFPLIALIGERIVGEATLHFNTGPARHRAEMRIFLAKDLKRRGLGTRFIQGIIEVARKRNIYLLEVQVVSDLVEVTKAFQKAGFEIACNMEDYFMLPDGDLRDVSHLILRLRKTEDEF